MAQSEKTANYQTTATSSVITITSEIKQGGRNAQLRGKGNGDGLGAD